jgi:hypothetical protein
MHMNKKLRLAAKLLLPGAVAIVISSCYPRQDTTTEDYDIAATVYDEATDFQSFQTFAVADTVMHITDSTGQDVGIEISRQYDNMVVDRVRQNMIEYGYQEVTDLEADTPDVILLVTAWGSENYVYYYDYWYDYWGWYGGWYGGYYPYYPWGGYTVYNYEMGTVTIEMFDMKDYDPNLEKIRAIWTGAINGLLDDYSSQVETRLQYGIDQCFKQSPYLKQN